jgi:hypothetical protein
LDFKKIISVNTCLPNYRTNASPHNQREIAFSGQQFILEPGQQQKLYARPLLKIGTDLVLPFTTLALGISCYENKHHNQA